MRDIYHRTLNILKGRGKVITLREYAQDKESATDIRKNFIYIAYPASCEELQAEPQVHIEKSFDSTRRIERFSFRVKGFFYVDRNRQLLKVAFRHTLKIQLHWNSESLKKTPTLA